MNKSMVYVGVLVLGSFFAQESSAWIKTFNDFNGDRQSDLAVYQASGGNWFIKTLGGQTLGWFRQWGYAGTLAVPADYNGDGKTDLGVYDPARGVWYIQSLNPAQTLAWGYALGGPGYVPVPGDFDGDGYDDIGVYELATGNWTVKSLATGNTIFDKFNWGFKGDERNWEKPVTSTVLPMPYDFDQDGTTDLAIYYRGFGMPDTAWYIRGSAGRNWFPTIWGSSGSLPAPGMYRNVVEFNKYPAGITVYKVKYSTVNNKPDGTEGTFNTPYMFQFKQGSYPRTLAVAGEDFDGNGWDDHAVYDYLNGNWTISFNDEDGNGNQAGTAYQQPPRQTINWGFSGAVPANLYSTIYAACKYTYKPW